MEFRKLRADEIDLRVGNVSEKGCTILLYKNARVDMEILDESVGSERWQRDHKEIKGNMYCGVGIYFDGIGWVWKWDAGKESNTEAEKGEASDSFKRACVNWGIGRELYSPVRIFHFCDTEKNGNKHYLKNQYETYGMKVSKISYDESGFISYLEIVDKKGLVVFEHGESPADKHLNKVETIDPTMAKTIIDLADLKKVSLSEICKAYKVESVYSLTHEQAGKVKSRLMKTEAKK